MNASTTKPIIDANALEAIAKERPNEKFLKGSGVLKLIQAIRDLERANRQLQAEQPIQIKNLRKALQFYADGHHFIKSDGDAWDTVSGEPQNYWCDEAGTATVEDGSIAKLALAGHPIKFEDEDTTAQAAPAAGAVAGPGWKCVPIVLSGDMKNAAHVHDIDADTLVSIWQYLLAAAPTPAAQADSLEEAGLLDWQASARVEVSPEYEGPWHAAVFGEDEKPVFVASGNTPREALIAARKQGGAT